MTNSTIARRLNALRKHKRGGRPRKLDRCPCGAMTRTRAAKRKHQCEAAHA